MIRQRSNECQLASLATLNGLRQGDYDAISAIIRKRKTDRRHVSHHTDLIKRTFEGMGLRVPAGFGDWSESPKPPKIPATGSGIALFKIGRGLHVVAFRDGVLLDTTPYPCQYIYSDYVKRWGRRRPAKLIRLYV